MNSLIVYPRFSVTHWGFQHGLRLIGRRSALHLAPSTPPSGVD
jgi:hypothetical protein